MVRVAWYTRLTFVCVWSRLQVPATEAYSLFEEAADEDGSLTREMFHNVFQDEFLHHQSSIEFERGRILLDQLFDAFDVYVMRLLCLLDVGLLLSPLTKHVCRFFTLQQRGWHC